MRRTLITTLLLLVSGLAFGQSRYIPIGLNGTSMYVYTTIHEDEINDAFLETGYSLGGRMNLRFQGGALFTTVDGSQETIPNFAIGMDLLVLKQQESVPFSLEFGTTVGFISVQPDNKAIFGSDFGFNFALSRDFSIGRFLIGIGGTFQFDRYQFDIHDPETATNPTSTDRIHMIRYGVELDLGFNYSNENLLIANSGLLFDEAGGLYWRFGLNLVVPTTI